MPTTRPAALSRSPPRQRFPARPGTTVGIVPYSALVDQDGDLHPSAGGLGLDGLDLGLIAVDEGDPGPLAGGVAAVRLVEPGGDDSGDVVGDGAGQPFPGGGRALLAGLDGIPAGPGDDVGGGGGDGRAGIDAADGHGGRGLLARAGPAP